MKERKETEKVNGERSSYLSMMLAKICARLDYSSAIVS